MFNILPPQQRKYLTHEYSVRLTVVLLAIISLAAIFLFGSLFPAYFLSLSKQHSEETTLADAQKASSEEKVDPHTSFAELKSFVDSINHASPAVTAREIINAVVTRKVTDIKITGFDLGSSAEGIRTVTVVGVAANRESIQFFKKRLEGEKLFKKVMVPLSNFQKNKDIQFTINITIAS